jgi:hypothetical protein
LAGAVYAFYLLAGVLAAHSFTPDGLVAYAVLGVLSGVGVIAAGIWNSKNWPRRTIGFLRSLSPKVRDAAFDPRVGYLVVLDNGIVLRKPPANGQGFIFTRFANQSGELINLTATQAVEFVRTNRRATRTGMLASAGSTWGVDTLQELRGRLGSTRVRISVKKRNRQGGPGFAYIAELFFLDQKWWLKAEPVTQNLGLIFEVIERATMETVRTSGVD